MSLPTTNLDDRKFQDLVDEAKRMIPQLCPEWTNHNLSDPGVALIELFAWMTEMSLYRLNQVPDNFYTHMLNLLGFEQFPASAARCDLTFWLNGSAKEVPIPAGTQVTTAGSIGQSYMFTTLEDNTVRSPDLMAALTSEGDENFVDVWEDLKLGLSEVACFPRTPVTPGDCFYLGFEGSLAGNAVQLTIEASAQGIGVIPDRPPLVWEVWQGEGWVEARLPDLPGRDMVADTTGGLNRDGTVLLLVPNVHEPLILGGTRAYWIRARLTATSDDQPGYRRSPQIRRVKAASIGGTVRAEHSEQITDDYLGVSEGRPGQVFSAARSPILPRNDAETLEVTHNDVTESWFEVADFVDSAPDDTHFCWDSSTGAVQFGPLIRYPDGSSRQHGAIPAENAQLRLTSYRTGGGAAGNVGAGTITSLRTSIPYVTSVENLRSATGGVDPETVANARERGPMSMRAGGRAVTVSDFERLTSEADSRVGRVRCLAPREAGDPIRLLVVPAIKEPPETLHLDHFALPDDMIASISGYLDERRILGSSVEVGTPYFQGVTVAALLTARPGRPGAVVRERAMRTLYDFINPLTGGAEGNGWPFDADLNSAQVFQILDAVEGVERVDEVLFFEYDLRNQQRMGFGKEMVKLGSDSLFLSTNHQVVVR
ncbi:MAG: putative baseplate assembly protein [Acidimicrobiaceae bacterium]|jgi:predicted phage baseplate assembly protein|uniref:putative baseplate assembly protein n=1 Tax=Ilumatobacter sp. TaxID=1967498 RepID=UPI002A3161A6|nr:putative baseplate assembly protein [Acidimicrobiaceae bacterium]MDG0977425.1 putative baseplate assembly protein [Ilumatobacter sp.]